MTGLKYLASYVFRVASANSRIVDFDNDQVTFRYRKSGSNRWRTISMDAMEFTRRFLQDVLPSGVMKIRHYGFWTVLLRPDLLMLAPGLLKHSPYIESVGNGIGSCPARIT